MLNTSLARKGILIMALACFLLSVGCPGMWKKRGEDPWTTGDTVRQVLGIGLLALDWNQTRQNAGDPRYNEQNLILGDRPSRGRVDIYFPISAIIGTAFATQLKKPYRQMFQYGLIGVEGYCVYNNHENGW